MNKVVVAHVSEVPEGGKKIMKVGNTEIGIFRINSQFYAIKNICPHQGARLCSGVVTGTNLPSAVQEYVYGREGEIVRCPWHNWEFDIKTGKALCDEKIRVARYEVTQEGDTLVLHL